MLTAAFRECENLDDLFFNLRKEKVLPPSIPDPSVNGGLSKVFRDLSTIKAIFRPSNSILAKKDKLLTIYLYLVTFTRVQIEDIERRCPQVDIAVLSKYAKALKKIIRDLGDSLTWQDFLKTKADTKAEVLACFYSHGSKDVQSLLDNSNDSVKTVTPRRIIDPAEEFVATVTRARQEMSKFSK